VCEATHGEVIETATAYIAPGGKHMSLVKEASGKYRIRLSEEGPRSGHMPSVDVLFESLVGHRGLKRHIVLMTGMGSDGAKGMKALQDDGAETRIAEAEETCVIYGMPRSAVELGAANHVLPLQQIASFLAKEINTRKA
jgi:two-component system chemotaxis response regulator CheB